MFSSQTTRRAVLRGTAFGAGAALVWPVAGASAIVPPVDVRTFGAKGDGQKDESEAIQKAINTGLPVGFPPGIYRCKNLKLGSGTVLIGIGEDIVNPGGSLRVHPTRRACLKLDKLAEKEPLPRDDLKENNIVLRSKYYPRNILRSQVYLTSGSIDAGSKLLTDVKSVVGIEPGAVCRVSGAGGGFKDTQFTELVTDVSPADAKLFVKYTDGFPRPDSGVVANDFLVRIDSEIIRFSDIGSFYMPHLDPRDHANRPVGGSFSHWFDLAKGKRGHYGTSPAFHRKDAPVQLARDLVTVVKGVSVNTVTLQDPAEATVKDADVDVGVTGIRIQNLEFDGNKVEQITKEHPDPFTFAVYLDLAQSFELEKCLVHGACHGGVFVGLGWEGRIANCHLYDNGRKEDKNLRGASVWLFQRCRNVMVTGNRVRMVDKPLESGGSGGIYIDDRPNTGTPRDGPCTDNIIQHNTIDCRRTPPLNSGITVCGGQRNVIQYNKIYDCKEGLQLYSEQGIPCSEPTVGNVVRDNDISGAQKNIVTRPPAPGC